MSSSDFVVVVGSYDGALQGFSVKFGDEELPAVSPLFAFVPHTGMIPAICASSSGKFLVSGSSDSSIRIYHLRKLVEYGSLVHHEGTVNALKFFKDRYLLSGSQDSSLCIWKVAKGHEEHPWDLLCECKGHKGSVEGLAIHPSGKVALTVSAKPGSLRMWDLSTGTCCFKERLPDSAVDVEWAPDGSAFAILYKDKAVVTDSKMNSRCTVQQTTEVRSMCFVDSSTLALGGNDCVVELFDIVTGKRLHKFKKMDSRIRCLSKFSAFLIAGCSNGIVAVWEVETRKQVALFNVDTRITSLEASILPNVLSVPVAKDDTDAAATRREKSKGKKRKHEDT